MLVIYYNHPNISCMIEDPDKSPALKEIMNTNSAQNISYGHEKFTNQDCQILHILTKQDGIPTGLDLNFQVHSDYQAHILCAYLKIGIQEQHASLDDAVKATVNQHDPASVFSYAVTIRDAIIDCSCSDIRYRYGDSGFAFCGIARVKKIILMDYLRLFDDLNNLQHNYFANWQQTPMVNKTSKMIMYKTMYTDICQYDKNVYKYEKNLGTIKLDIKNIIQSNKQLSQGFWTNKTSARMKLLSDSLDNDHAFNPFFSDQPYSDFFHTEEKSTLPDLATFYWTN